MIFCSSVSVANLYPNNYSGKTDPQGFYIGKDKYGSNIIVDLDRRAEDKTNASMLILGNSGQGKSFLLKLGAEKSLSLFEQEAVHGDLGAHQFAGHLVPQGSEALQILCRQIQIHRAVIPRPTPVCSSLATPARARASC